MNKWYLALLGLGLQSGVMAATVWAPTDEDTNFLFTTAYSGQGTLAVFDDDDLTYSGPYLSLRTFDKVSFSLQGTEYEISNRNGQTLSLNDSYNFILGFTVDNGATWWADSAYYQFGDSDLYYIVFNGLGGTLANDITVQAVPVPAALWLFLSAIGSLLGYTRSQQRK